MNILVGVTGAPESRVAVERAGEEAMLRQGHVHLLIVVPGAPRGAPGVAKDWTERVNQARVYGDQLVQDFLTVGVSATCRVDASDTSFAGSLLSLAKQIPADLVVVGLRRRSPVGKLVLGSATQEVLLKADCPVLAVKSAEPGE